MIRKTALLLAALMLVSSPSFAAQTQDLEVLQRTVENLLGSLVQKGVLSAQEARAMVESAKSEASAPTPAAVDDTSGDSEADIRVTYVPEFVRDEIRAQVREELADEVVEDVIDHAEQQGWAMTDALPDWVRNTAFTADLTLRSQTDVFDSGNAQNVYRDFLFINTVGGEGRAGRFAFENTTQDRQRLRARLRLGAHSRLTDSTSANIRFSTGNLITPVSNMQTFGNYERRWQFLIDRLFLQQSFGAPDAGVEMWAGRMPNPWMATEMQFDDDLSFDGVVARGNRTVGNTDFFVTLGGFSVDELELSSRDKWLLGAQIGLQWRGASGIRGRAAIGYHDYQNITGIRNEPQSFLQDDTAPRFVQRGNTLFDIRNDTDPDTNLFALASDYDVAAAYLSLDFPVGERLGVGFEFEYLDNVGFDRDDVARRTGLDVEKAATAYQLGFSVGHTDVVEPLDWQVFGYFRHMERDSVLDAYSDSTMHLGGTDMQGYQLGGSLGLTNKSRLRL
ncbi:MAG: putative porin, partial [Pseudomonadota bacterium]